MKNIPKKYDAFLGPLMFHPYALDVAQRVPEHSHDILDVAAGTGISTQAVKERFPASTLIALDKSETMLDMAKSKLGKEVALFVRSNAEALPFKADTFDAVVCQFGLMFFLDQPAAIEEAQRVLRAGGSFVVTVWDELKANEVANVANRVARSFYSSNAPPFFDTPYSFFDRSAIEPAFRKAGFLDITGDKVELENEPVSAEDAAIGLFEGNPILKQILIRDPQLLPKMEEAVAKELRANFSDPIRSKLSAYVFSATK